MKDDKPWVATVKPGKPVQEPLNVAANTWCLARQDAAIVMRCEPGDLNVRAGSYDPRSE